MANADRKHGTGAATPTVTTQAELGVPADAEDNERTATGIEVVSADGDDPIYFTVDGSAPTVAGDGTYMCQAGGSARVSVRSALPVTVKMISASAYGYSLEVFAE